MDKQLKADLMLVFMTLCWGLSYVFIDISMTELGPLTLNSLRFTIAFVVSAVIFRKDLLTITKDTIKWAIFIGAAAFVAYSLVSIGIQYTSLSNAGFLAGLGVVFVPLIGGIVKREMPEKRFFGVILIAIVGISFLTINEGMSFRLGDILCFIASMTYSSQLLMTEHAVQKVHVNPFQLSILMMGFTAMFFLASAPLVEDYRLPSQPKVIGAVLFLGIVCTCLGVISQMVAQKYTTANRSGVIFSLEPVFAAFAAFFIAGEVLTVRGYIGAVILFSGIVYMEYPNIKQMLNENKQKKLKESGTAEDSEDSNDFGDFN